MATATAKATITSVDNTQKNEIVYGTITFSAVGDTYATAGLLLTSGLVGDLIKSSSQPNFFEMTLAPAAGTSPSGYSYFFCPGTSLTNGKIAIFNGTTEFSNGAAITVPFADVVVFRASFTRNL